MVRRGVGELAEKREVTPEANTEEEVVTPLSSGCGACGDRYWRRWSDIPCAPVAGSKRTAVQGGRV